MISHVAGYFTFNRSRGGKRRGAHSVGCISTARSNTLVQEQNEASQERGDATAPPLTLADCAPERPDLSPAEVVRWREEDEAFIKRHDQQQADDWFLVDVRWLKQWKEFVKRDGSLPGPVDNSYLIDAQTGQPRPGLFPVEDYRGVNADVWGFWIRRYGGGPVIQRRQLDLYAPAVPQADDDDLGATRLMRRPGAQEEDLDVTAVVPRVSAFAPNDAPPVAGTQGRPSRGSSVPLRGRRGSGSDTAKPPCCDKCDGPHETDNCTYFSKPREKHKDAWTLLGRASSVGASGEDAAPVVRNARVVAQPGDGSCLFHSLSYGLSGDCQGGLALRHEICDFIQRNPDIQIGDNALQDWVRYDSGGGSVQKYVQQMEGRTWGGGIEMAAFTKMKQVNVHVYEKCSDGYRRISAFEAPGALKTVSVLYHGRAHYDAIIV